MIRPAASGFLALALAGIVAAADDAPAGLDVANVVFATPSADASGAVPIGNGEAGACAWIEPSGDLVLYLVRPDSFSEASRLLKLGKVRIALSPAPLAAGAPFRQELKLRQGRLEADLGGTHLEVFVEPDRPIIRVTAHSAAPVTARVSDEGWRGERRVLKGAELIWTMHDAPASVEVAESADVRLGAAQAPGALAWYHRNEDSVVPLTLRLQSCAQLPGAFDPLIHRTFGAWIDGPGLVRGGDGELVGAAPSTDLDVRIACPLLVAERAEDWVAAARDLARAAPLPAPARARAEAWWRAFWARSWILVSGEAAHSVPANAHPVRIGVDSGGGNRFPGAFGRVGLYTRALAAAEIAALAAGGPHAAAAAGEGRAASVDAPAVGSVWPEQAGIDLGHGFSVEAWIKPDAMRPGRIVDKLTAGAADGFLFDTHPGDALRLIVGEQVASVPKALKPGVWQHVAATYDAASSTVAIYLDGREALRNGAGGDPVSCDYNRQRFVTACQGRGEFPIKFNGGTFTVEPRFAKHELAFNADWRQWGDCFWYQNTRHMYHPLLASGDTELMAPFFALYSRARTLAESRAKSWYGAEGCYFPETMTVFGTYANGDYGWDRRGSAPGEVKCPWWHTAWNQGPELVALMLDRWEWTGDEAFARQELVPMAESVLRWFDSRFKKDAHGLIVLDPCQVIETYWHGVVDDLPCVAGLRDITTRLTALPEGFASAEQRAFFARMRQACPPVPTEERTVAGKPARSLAPAEKYQDKTSNCENPELYAVWPFRLYGVGKPDLELALTAYATRRNHLDNGWGYDGNAAALLGLRDEAARILLGKCRNSHPAYRFPATWGPNFDWLPDQNHGGNLMETAQLMLLQSAGGRILLLPAWPTAWNVDFRLHAPGRTVVEGAVEHGRLVRLAVTPAARRADVVVCAPFTLPP
jgi:hypothetical protein